ncbi:MAG TPA: aldehyde dehydrogenase family protein, partial [Lacipirellulaceae bacterium]|nr:aldehyde dehydrogenase family protein [Lacipirellulaceae bacterium]
SHSGQKCSATSLLILEEEVYNDGRFRDALVDAVESLAVGSAWELPTRVGPLIRPPSGALERGLKDLEPGEEWAVMPRLHVGDNPCLASPGVKWNVAPHSFTHCTELFGPVLGVMQARDLDEAIELVNATGYGLTSGLESLDEREHRRWRQRVRAGNLYINRPTTGAIVLRQPFGGLGKSAFGPGVKAGGPNYIAPLMHVEDRGQETGVRGQESGVRNQDSRAFERVRAGASPPPADPASLARSTADLTHLRDALAHLADDTALPAHDRTRLVVAVDDFLHWAAAEFAVAHDHFRLVGEDNFRRYLPVEGLAIRLHEADSPLDAALRIAAARAVGGRVVVSSPPELGGTAARARDLLDRLTDPWAAAIEFIDERDEALVAAIAAGRVMRVRYAAPDRVPASLRRAAAEALAYVADAPPVACGRAELLWYVQEQSLSHAYHRYGNLGRRAGEPRAPVE